jgi:hypothetical protein
MDNASNCDSAADHMQELIPSFRGRASHSRCFPHTINLIAKVLSIFFVFVPLTSSCQAFLSFFYRQPKRKRQVKVTKRGRKHNLNSNADEDHVVTLEDGQENAELTPLEQDLLDEESGKNLGAECGDVAEMVDEVDEAKDAHDREVVRSVRQQAIATAKAADITMTSLVEREALGMFPKVNFFGVVLHNIHTSTRSLASLVNCMTVRHYRRNSRGLSYSIVAKTLTNVALIVVLPLAGTPTSHVLVPTCFLKTRLKCLLRLRTR